MRALSRSAAAVLVATAVTVLAGGLTACGAGDAVRDDETGETFIGVSYDNSEIYLQSMAGTAR